MRCKKHPCDLSSSVGVCASCLRERLLSLMAAQLQSEAQLLNSRSSSSSLAAAATAPQPPPPPHPPLTFPRSVSPYIAPRRKSDDTSSWSSNYHHHLRFYSTPQVGPTYSNNCKNNNKKKKKLARFSLLSNLFKSRSDKFNPDDPDPDPDPGRNYSGDAVSSSSSPSWFSAIFSSSRSSKKQSVDYSSSVVVRKPCRRIIDRGMSPARGADSDEEDDCYRSPSGSGSSSESSHKWKRTPVSGPPTASVRRTKTGHVSSSGLAFCLSPLVRASPNRHWNQKGGGNGGLPPDLGFPGDNRAPVKPHLSTAATYCANRSRKLCDFGRVNPNR